MRAAGYPDRPNGPLVVVRDGRVIARATIAEFPKGWEIDSVEGCARRGAVALIPIPARAPVPYDPAPCLRSRSLSCPVTASDPR